MKGFLTYGCIVMLFIIFHVFFVKSVFDFGENYYNKRILQKKTKPKVFDLGHKYIPHTKNNYIHDFVLILPLMLLLLPLLPLFPSNDGFIYEFLYKLLIIFTIRHFTNILTILPKINNEPKKELNNSDYIFGHCYDYIFSGHFASLLLFLLILNKYNLISLTLLIIFSIIYALLILALRFHYSIDIIVAFFVTLFVFDKF